MENVIKKNLNSNILVPTILFFIIFILYVFSLSQFKITLTEYVLIENLINYEGGFVRRGFLGNIIFKLNQYTGINYIKIIVSIYLIAYTFFIIISCKVLNKIWKVNPYLFLFVLISPSTFFFPLFDFSALFRKEIFFFILLFYHVYIAQQTIEKKKSIIFYKRCVLFTVFPGLLFNILIHEFQFFLIFFHVFINLSILKYENNKEFYFCYLIFFLVFSFFIFPATFETINQINYSLEKFLPGISEKYSAVTILTGNINLQLGQTLTLFKNSNFLEFLQLIFVFIFTIFIYSSLFNILIKKNELIDNYQKNLILLLNVFSLLVLNLFIILSFDYGRLFNIFLIHIIGFYLVLPYENFQISKINFTHKLKYSLFITLYFLFFYLPHAHIIGGKGSIFEKMNNGLILFLK